MNRLEVLVYPHPFLKTIAKPVKDFDDHLKTLSDEMIETMYENLGIGLAATQVGVDKQMFVMDIHQDSSETSGQARPITIINPKITKQEGRLTMEEGCLSVPEYRSKVERWAKITLEYQDLEGDKHEMEAEGLLAVCVQHELDHLLGKLFIDRISPLKRKIIQTKVKKKFAKK